MVKNLLKTLTNNFGFKLLALFFAFVLWLAVYNIDDPVKGRTFSINVTYDNVDKIKEAGFYPLLGTGGDTIPVYVTAKRSVIKELDDSSFTATVDLSQFTSPEEDDDGQLYTTVKASIKCNRSIYESQLDYSGKNLQDIDIKVDEYTSKKCKLVAQTVGEPMEGFALDSSATTLATSRMTIKGPEKVVSKISDKAYVYIDITDATDGFSDVEKYTLVDEDGNEIKAEDMSELDISSKYDNISYAVSILPTKELPIKCTTTGLPVGGNQVRTVKCSPSTVKVMGKASDLNKISSIEVTDPIDVTNITEDLITQINVTAYLPDGIMLVNSEDATIDVTVKVKAYKTQSFTVDTSNIKIVGFDSNLYDVVFSASTVSLEVSGAEEDLALIDESQLTGTIDLSSYGEGTHNVTVTMDLDGTTYTYELTVQVTIKAKGNGNQQDADEGSEANNSESTEDATDNKDNSDGDNN